jgi:hypothetical protein
VRYFPNFGPLNGGFFFNGYGYHEAKSQPLVAFTENLQKVTAVTEFLAGSGKMDQGREKATRS